MKTKNFIAITVLATLLGSALAPAPAQGSPFTYQGRLTDHEEPANGSYDLVFDLFDVPIGGTSIAGPITNLNLAITGGVFTTALDFGDGIFNGLPRWLQIGVRTNGGATFAGVLPRQLLTPAPYAIHAFSARLTNGAIDTPQLSAGAVTRVKIASNAVDTLQLADGSVTTPKLALGAVDTPQIANGAVTALKLASNSVTGAKIADLAVDTAQLANGAVTTAKLASNAVTNLKVADGTLRPDKLDLDEFNTTFWKVGGNAGTSTDFIGTTDDQPFDIKVNNVRVMRYRLLTDASGFYTNAPNVVGGSSVNTTLTTVVGVTIAGGGANNSLGDSYPNKVSANFGTIGGGKANEVSGIYSTISGGDHNTVSGNYATATGGDGNVASGEYSMVGGWLNTASGDYATVCGGALNDASGQSSFAAGTRAKADHNGSFVWADYNTADFHSFTSNQFAVRCTGGAKFVTAIDGSGTQTAGVRLQSGDTAWSSISDRNVKKNFQAVDGETILEKLATIPVQSWNYTWESDATTPHLGPMAQDFKAAFYPGRDDKSISTLEFDGVELAAIQGLNQKLRAKESQITALENRVTELEKLVKTLTAAQTK
jgi:hypothetical protein